ncbi:MAG: transposase [Anaerolineales bacterium]|nr:transposase [Anaerolineales bacterium]
MKFDPQKHHRRSIRLKDYDYSQAGAYYVTINVQNRECLFGKIVNYEMKLNDAGKMIEGQWNALLERFSNVELDVYQTMPNHFHGIIVVGAAFMAALDTNISENKADTRPAPTLGDIVGAFKSITTHEYILGVDNKKWPRFYKRLWQRNYYEHIVRDEADLERIRDYIQSNPADWDEDEENPKFKKI